VIYENLEFRSGIIERISDMLLALKSEGSKVSLGRFLLHRRCPWGLSPTLLSLGAFTRVAHSEPANPTGLNASRQALLWARPALNLIFRLGIDILSRPPAKARRPYLGPNAEACGLTAGHELLRETGDVALAWVSAPALACMLLHRGSLAARLMAVATES
jgi:hypothetical protein